MKKAIILEIIIILIAIAVSLYVYPQLPEKIASHWDASGNVNGYMNKLYGLSIVPALMILFFLIFLAILKIDPLRKNIESFRSYYEGFVVFFMAYLFSIQAMIILWALGIEVNVIAVISLGIAILFFYISILLKKSRRNWFIGIRTPWTLSDDRVWKKTHELGSILFKIISFIALIGIVFPRHIIYIFIIPVIIMAIILFVYSYIIYKKIKK